MDDRAEILLVDDDSTMLEWYGAGLGQQFRVNLAASGEEALAAAGRQRYGVILLDVEMPPGIDGYETCRRLKSDQATAETPVIFLSGRDCIEDRLKGYEAGGDDYLIKPASGAELAAKIGTLLKAAAQRAELQQTAAYASSTAMTAMTSMSEMGTLLEAISTFGACADYLPLAEAMLRGLALYGLQATVQIRAPALTLTRNAQGEASSLEVSVIEHMAGLERIVQFKSRMCITYQRVSLLVHNMPVDDADRCGRLRDHLAMLAEAADTRAETITANGESQRRGAGIERAVARITAALADIDRAQRHGQVTARLAAEKVSQRLEAACISVALSATQEDYMTGIVKEGLDHLLNAQTSVVELQNQLSSVVHELQAVSGAGAAA